MNSELVAFLNAIRNIKSLMYRVSKYAFGINSIQKKESEYQELRASLKKYFNLFGLDDPNGFSTLEDFHGYWDTSLPKWKDRREFIRDMYDEIEKTVESSLKSGKPLELKSKNKEPARIVKIMFLSANPQDMDSLRFDKEFRDIEHNITHSQNKDRIKIVTKLAVRLNDLQLYLNEERPNIVHFSGHGNEQGIFLENDSGRSQLVKTSALAAFFKILNNDIKCVVLNSCFSSKHAPVIAEDIDCTIGMSIAINDETAIKFSTGFYSAIASGNSIKNAFEQGIARIKLESISEDYVPKLFYSNKDPSKIFLNKAMDNISSSSSGKLTIEEAEVIATREILKREKTVTDFEITQLKKEGKIWIVEGGYSKQLDQSGREWPFFFTINLDDEGSILYYNSNS